MPLSDNVKMTSEITQAELNHECEILIQLISAAEQQLYPATLKNAAAITDHNRTMSITKIEEKSILFARFHEVLPNGDGDYSSEQRHELSMIRDQLSALLEKPIYSRSRQGDYQKAQTLLKGMPETEGNKRNNAHSENENKNKNNSNPFA